MKSLAITLLFLSAAWFGFLCTLGVFRWKRRRAMRREIGRRIGEMRHYDNG